MKKVCFIILVAILCNFIHSSAQNNLSNSEVLTNLKVIELNNKGLGGSILVSKIQTSKCNFDISTDALIKLKESKVSDEVITAMITSMNGNAAVNADPNNPLSPHESGIWVNDYDNNRMVQLEPNIFTKSQSGSSWGHYMSNGIAPVSLKAVIDGVASRIQFQTTTPEFYFYFDNAKVSGQPNYRSAFGFFSNVSSPNEFILTKCKQAKRTREVTVGSYSNFSSSKGVADKQKIRFKMEKISTGIYKVTPEEDLQSGEYCFMYAGEDSYAGQTKLFDFGIK